MGIRLTAVQAKNEWLAELLMRQRDLVTRYWIEDIRADNIPSYHAVTDEQLLQELPSTVDSMIYAFKTGDAEGPRRHSIGVMRRRLAQGFLLPELQMSLHSLETAVMRVVEMADVGPVRELEALSSAGNMYYQVALIAAEVYEQLRIEQQKRFTTAYELGITLSRTLDLESVLNTAVEKVAEHMQVDSTAIVLAGSEGRRDQVRAYQGLDAVFAKSMPGICRSLGCSREAVDELTGLEAACTASNVRTCSHLKEWASLLVSHGYMSLICVPLLAKQTYLGSLVILRREVHEASTSETAFVYAMASHIANAIQNAILYEEAQGKRELGVLLKASKLFASSLNTGEVLQKIARMATEAVGADLAMVFLPDQQQEHLRAVAHYSSSRRARSALLRIVEEVTPENAEVRYGGLLHAFVSGRPILLDDYSEFPGRSESLAGIIGSVLTVPLRRKNTLLGAFTLISMSRHAFTQDDLSLATGMADLAAVAIENARLFEYERRIAETLQRSFLPSVLPSIEGYDSAALYRPAMAEAEIGGDFYDAFVAGDGIMSIVIADVSGKGLDAAVQTAMGKYTVRAYAVADPSPAHVLAQFNRILHEYAPEELFITAFLGVLDPVSNILTYVSAGHNPPLLYSSKSGTVYEIEVDGMTLGIIPYAAYVNKTLKLEPLDVLLLYTDGATDVKADGERLNVEGLQQLLLSSAHSSAEQIVRDVFDGIWAFGHERLTDDVALVALKRQTTRSRIGSR